MLWYQGESNVAAFEGNAYGIKLKALVNGWRKEWGQGEFPFCAVLLPPFRYTGLADPIGRYELCKVREGQMAILSLPNTGLIGTTDIGGDLGDIHPPNKEPFGRRLATWALAQVYGRKELVYSGPLYKSMAVEGSKVRIDFDRTGAGLAARDGKPLDWFEIAGTDRKFVKADAAIDGDTVLVSSPSIAAPAAVRFGWDEEAQPNLMNREGLPAFPFRTDNW
jgi:sialate O-acetylesterase